MCCLCFNACFLPIKFLKFSAVIAGLLNICIGIATLVVGSKYI